MFQGKKAIVTGGTRGIGEAIAKELVQKGCKVIITGRTKETVEKAAANIGAIPFVWDVSDCTACTEKFAECTKILAGLDIVVNNAGIFALRNEWSDEQLLKTTFDEWDTVIRTNTSAVFFIMQNAVKFMLENGIKGNILNISSVAGQEPVFGAYGASKAATTALTRGWGKKFASSGITINGIAPGPVATEMNGWHEGDPMEHSRVPYGRYSTSDEIATLAMYLLSEEAKMVCGDTVILDGAYSIR